MAAGPEETPRTRWRWWRIAASAAAIAMILASAGAGLAYWRLTEGPVSLGFALPQAARLLDFPDYGLRAEPEDIVVTWRGLDRPLHVEIDGLRFRNPAGQVVARFDRAAADVSTQALLGGRIGLVRLELVRPRLQLPANPPRDGGDRPATDAPPNRDTPASLAVDALFRIQAHVNRHMPFLERLRVTDAAAEFALRQELPPVTLPDIDVDIRRNASGVAGSFTLAADIGGDTGTVRGTAAHGGGDGSARLALDFAGFGLRTLMEQMAGATGRFVPRTDLSGRLSLALDGDGTLSEAAFALETGPGAIPAPVSGAAPLKFQRLALGGRFDPASGRVLVDDTALAFDAVRIAVRNATVRLGGTAEVRARVEAADIGHGDLAGLWPEAVGAGARRWALANLAGGTVRTIAADVTASVTSTGDGLAVEVTDFAGRAALEGYSVTYLAPMPPVRGVDAEMTFADDRVDFRVRGGRAGALAVREAEIRIRGIARAHETISISLTVAGPVRAALALLRHPRLGIPPRPGGGGAAVSGTHVTRLEFAFPLLDGLATDEVKVSAKSKISKFRVPRIFRDIGLRDGRFELEFSGGKLAADGTARIAGQPVRMSMRQTFSGRRTRTISGSATVGPETAARFGLDVAPYLQGPVGTRFVLKRGSGIAAELSLTLDLGPAGVTVPVLDRIKEPQEPGTARLKLAFPGDRSAILKEFSLDTDRLKATARRLKDRLWQARIASGSSSINSTVEFRADGSVAVDATGQEFDAQPFLAAASGNGASDLPPFRVLGTFRKLWIDPKFPLDNAQILLDRDPAGWRRARLKARLPGNGRTLEAQLSRTARGHDLTVKGDDAGAILAALGVTDAMSGGALDLRAQRAAGSEDAWKGTATTGEFRIARTPPLVQLLKRMSLAGITRLSETDELRFTKMVIPFEYLDGIANIGEARVSGPELSLTASGKLDLAGDTVDLNGNVVPAPVINRALAGIPILGTLAAGGDESAVFAASWRAEGPLSDPRIAVDPLSLLTPGILRKVIEGFSEGLASGAKLRPAPVPPPVEAD